MSLHRQWAAFCDHCDDNGVSDFIDSHSTKRDVIIALRREGWRIGKTVKCPECVKNNPVLRDKEPTP